MNTDTRQIGVVLRRSPVDHPWQDHVWAPEAVLALAPEAEAGTSLGQDGAAQLVYGGAVTLDLYSSDTAFYRENLLTGEPKIWIALKRDEDSGDMSVMLATADPNEGEISFESGADIVATVPMPYEIAGWIAGFCDAFHVERPFIKRQRDKSGPDPRKNPGARQAMDKPAGAGGRSDGDQP